jgi:hypothetical protein
MEVVLFVFLGSRSLITVSNFILSSIDSIRFICILNMLDILPTCRIVCS